MKKQDIEKGKLYVVDTPGTEFGRKGRYGSTPWKITAEAVEVGVSREGSKRLDGVRVALREEFRRSYGPKGENLQTLPAGFEYVVSTAEVERPVESHDAERIVQARVERYALLDRVLAALAALGASVAPEYAFADFDVKVTADEVTFSTEFFDRWIRRIDPVRIVEEAFAEVDRERPRDEQEYQDARSAVLEEVRQGLRVADAEIGAGADSE